MTLFGANISVTFQEFSPLDRLQAASSAGFEAVEWLFPYEFSIEEITEARRAARIPLVLINTPAPDWDQGGRGVCAIAGREARFRTEFLEALAYAQALDVRFIHIMSGLAAGPEAKRTMIENLRWAAKEAGDQLLTIEPINPTDMPGYFMNDYALAAEIIDEVAASNLALQFDAYHAARITGDAFAVWSEFKHLTKHIQIAGVPDRHEPDAGSLDYSAFFDQIKADGYDGCVSAEYFPRAATLDGIGWLKMAKSRR